LPVQEFPQGIDRLQTYIRDFRAGTKSSVAQLPDQILQPVRYRAQAPQTHLRRRSFYRMDRAEKPVDFFGGRIRFEAEQALGRNLQMLFSFGNEKVQDFPGNIIIFGEVVG
jgi:hypothetical protein